MQENKVFNEIKTLEILLVKKINQHRNLEDCKDKPPTPTQMQILKYIFEHKNEEIYQKDLENIFNLSRATVSSVLQTMEKYELISRITDENDTRTKKIVLNHKAKEIFYEHAKVFKELEKVLLKDVKKDDLDVFFKVLEKMKENISNTLK